MIRISEVTKELLSESDLTNQLLLQGLINYSALARKLQPTISDRLMKDVSINSIVMALKRESRKMKPGKTNHSLKKYIGDIIVRSNLYEYTYLNSETTAQKQKLLVDLIYNRFDLFVEFTQGVNETTIIISHAGREFLENIFVGEKLVKLFPDISSITIKITEDVSRISGFYYTVLKLLAWENIAMKEMTTTHREFTIFLDNKDVDRAFSVIKSYVQDA